MNKRCTDLGTPRQGVKPLSGGGVEKNFTSPLSNKIYRFGRFTRITRMKKNTNYTNYTNYTNEGMKKNTNKKNTNFTN
jgi:hypothetical protein